MGVVVNEDLRVSARGASCMHYLHHVYIRTWTSTPLSLGLMRDERLFQTDTDREKSGYGVTVAGIQFSGSGVRHAISLAWLVLSRYSTITALYDDKYQLDIAADNKWTLGHLLFAAISNSTLNDKWPCHLFHFLNLHWYYNKCCWWHDGLIWQWLIFELKTFEELFLDIYQGFELVLMWNEEGVFVRNKVEQGKETVLASSMFFEWPFSLFPLWLGGAFLDK